MKRNRRHVWSLGSVFVLFLLAALTGSWMAHRVITQSPSQVFLPMESASAWADDRSLSVHPTSRDRTLQALRIRQGQVELVLHRKYLCGEETRQLGAFSASEATDLLKSHRQWDATMDASGKVLMEESIDDLSPECRKTGYIGLDKDGNLTLFDGPPWHKKVIRTFFQLDVEMMESRLSDDRIRDLASGIRVTDKDEYNSVLSTFNEYAILR